MTSHTTPTPVLTWTDDELSELFWHHHNRFRAATGIALGLSVVGVVFLALEKHGLAAAMAPAELIMWGFAIWHRAHSRLLTKLRFRDAK